MIPLPRELRTTWKVHIISTELYLQRKVFSWSICEGVLEARLCQSVLNASVLSKERGERTVPPIIFNESLDRKLRYHGIFLAFELLGTVFQFPMKASIAFLLHLGISVD